MLNNIKLQVYKHFTQVVVNDNVQLCLCDLQLRNAYSVTDIAFRSYSLHGWGLSCECLERLDLGLNSGWVSFTARFIKLVFFPRLLRKMNPKKVLTGGAIAYGGRMRA